MTYTRNPAWVDGTTAVDSARMENIEGGLVALSGPTGGPQQFRPGYYYGAWRAIGSLYDTFTMTAGTLYAMPFNVGETTPVDQLVLTVTVAGAAGTVARMGVYKSSRLVPSALVADGGAVSVATTGAKTATISATLDPGLYWLVVVTDATGLQVRALASDVAMLYLRTGQTIGDWHDGNQVDNWRMTGYVAASALPSTASLAGLTNGSGVGRDVVNLNIRAA